MKSCRYCGEQIQDAAKKCRFCGEYLTGRSRSASGPAPKSSKSSAGLLILVLGGGVLLVVLVPIALLRPAVQQAREAARGAQCRNNLKQIGLALHNYHTVHKSFPPAFVADANGTPLYSWRVLILPYMDQQALHSRFNLDEAWDSPQNQPLLNQMPPSYACPSSEPGAGETAYTGAFGDGCMFNKDGPVRFRDIKDGTSNTIMVIEAAGAGIPWSAPRDIDFSAISTVFDDHAGCSSEHTGGVHALIGDGTVKFISENIDQGMIRSLFTIADGQSVGAF